MTSLPAGTIDSELLSPELEPPEDRFFLTAYRATCRFLKALRASLSWLQLLSSTTLDQDAIS